MSLALITGASAGFGKAIAYQLAKENYNLVIVGRRAQLLNEIAQDIKSKFNVDVAVCCLDVTSKEDVFNHLGKLNLNNIDVLVNNAGLAAGLSTIQDGDINDWETMIDTNVKGLLFVSKVVMPFMVKNKSGHIINIGSIAGKDVYPRGNVYCATKHAVDAISKAMRIDLLPYGIKVTAIHPGAAETEFSLVRYKGDIDKAKQVYKGFDPLVANDIANIVSFVINQPKHVVLNDIVVTPLAQAAPAYMFKDEN